MDYVQLFNKELDGQRVNLLQRGISQPYLIVRIGRHYEITEKGVFLKVFMELEDDLGPIASR
jgi:hypothetical protein